jgi:hypothetical protein
MAHLPRKKSILIVKGYFDKVKEFLMRLDIMDMRERIYNAYNLDAGKVSSFFVTGICHFN